MPKPRVGDKSIHEEECCDSNHPHLSRALPGRPCRTLSTFPPWAAMYQQSQRCVAAGCFETLAQDLRAVLRLVGGRTPNPTAAIIDSRTLRSTPESGTRAGYDGAKRKRGSKVHMAVDTLGHLLASHVTPADVGDRAAVGRLCADSQDATGKQVQLAYVDQGYIGDAAAEAASVEGIALHVVKLPEGKRGSVLLPRRWVVERSFAWATRCRCLVKDYERYASTLAGFTSSHSGKAVPGRRAVPYGG